MVCFICFRIQELELLLLYELTKMVFICIGWIKTRYVIFFISVFIKEINTLNARLCRQIFIFMWIIHWATDLTLDLLVDSHNIVNKGKNYFTKLLNNHAAGIWWLLYIYIYIYTAELLVPKSGLNEITFIKSFKFETSHVNHEVCVCSYNYSSVIQSILPIFFSLPNNSLLLPYFIWVWLICPALIYAIYFLSV